MIQVSENLNSPSCTPMASSSKQNTNEIGVKESNASSLDPKTEALYAFRTITTMLSLIQSTRGTGTAGNRPKLGCQEKQLLQLLDAFAAVLVRNNGVIAITARPYDGSGKVEVLASYLGNGESLTISQPWSTGQFMNLIRNVFISQNPRDSTVKHREVVDPETSVPVYFKEISDPSKLLTAFLIHMW
jgi:hypothetical protein